MGDEYTKLGDPGVTQVDPSGNVYKPDRFKEMLDINNELSQGIQRFDCGVCPGEIYTQYCDMYFCNMAATETKTDIQNSPYLMTTDCNVCLKRLETDDGDLTKCQTVRNSNQNKRI